VRGACAPGCARQAWPGADARAARRSFEEDIGIAVVAVLARQRRRLAAAALAGALAAGASPALTQPAPAGRALALMLRALEDERAFQARIG